MKFKDSLIRFSTLGMLIEGSSYPQETQDKRKADVHYRIAHAKGCDKEVNRPFYPLKPYDLIEEIVP